MHIPAGIPGLIPCSEHKTPVKRSINKAGNNDKVRTKRRCSVYQHCILAIPNKSSRQMPLLSMGLFWMDEISIKYN